MGNKRRFLNGALLLSIDLILIELCYFMGVFFMSSDREMVRNLVTYNSVMFVVLLVYAMMFWIFGLYRSLWTQAGIDEFIRAVTACILSNGIILLILSTLSYNISMKTNLLCGIFVMIAVIGFRVSFRIYRRLLIDIEARNNKVKRVLIYGAGYAGKTVALEIKNQSNKKYKVIGFIDDDKSKRNMIIGGSKVLGNKNDIPMIVDRYKIEQIIVAIPSLNNDTRCEIIEKCSDTKCKVKILPSISEIIDEKVSIGKMRNVEIEDLLGRDPIKLNDKEIKDYIENKRVLVTGGGGSIGSELCRQIVKFKPSELLILDIYENNAYDLQNELKDKFKNLKVAIASVRDEKRLDVIFDEFRPQLVFHAAAHKHVPLMEDSPGEAIKNNTFGTLKVAECADRYGAEKFVLISTDKAVNPTNVMGATKRMCEMIVQAMAEKSKTEFVAVRFGNVLGSNGSVIPLFKRQIANGGPVTVTNKNIIRYFMTIPEAAQLVLQAGAYAKGGEIFVLDMGKPVRIYDLALNLIKLSGLEPHEDIEIKVTGLRPGEKLYEELLMSEEGLTNTENEKIFIAKPMHYDLDKLKMKFDNLKVAIDSKNMIDIRDVLEEVVPTYKRAAHDMVAATKE